MAGGWVALSKNMFLIVINSRSALEIPNYIYICNFDKFIHFRKKMATIVCHFFPPWEVLELLKLVLFNTIHFFFFQWICFSQGSVSILQVQVAHTSLYCMRRMYVYCMRPRLFFCHFLKTTALCSETAI